MNVSYLRTLVTRIEALRRAAVEDDDRDMVHICDLALSGQSRAIQQCERVLADGEARS